jgi:PST family polysaccharide transporter
LNPATPEHRGKFKHQVFSGLAWSAGGRVAQQVIAFGLTIVLSRLLSPEDYGEMAMVMVFTGFAGMLADAGFTSALVQKQEMAELLTETVFWLNTVSGLLLTAITFAFAPWLAVFFHAPALKTIFRVVAVIFILTSLGNVPGALLQKRMDFRTLVRIDTWSLFLSGVLGVALALSGAGVWSLVAQSLANTFLVSLLRCASCRWLPRWRFSKSALKSVWGYAGNLYGFNLINYWARNADRIVIGKFFGAAPVGLYNRAYGLMLLPITQVNSVISAVVFPAFASIQNDKPRVKRIYLRAIGMVALITFPVMFGLLVTAQPFILAVYGPKWIGVVPLLQILALVGAMQVLINSVGGLYLSQGRTDILLKWGVVFSIVVLLSFGVGLALGSVRAVAVCYCVANILLFYPSLVLGGGVINTRASELLAAVAGPFFASLAMMAVVFAASRVLPPDWRAWWSLAVLVGTGAGVYSALVLAFKLSAGREVIGIIRQKRGTAGPVLEGV